MNKIELLNLEYNDEQSIEECENTLADIERKRIDDNNVLVETPRTSVYYVCEITDEVENFTIATECKTKKEAAIWVGEHGNCDDWFLVQKVTKTVELVEEGNI